MHTAQCTPLLELSDMIMSRKALIRFEDIPHEE